MIKLFITEFKDIDTQQDFNEIINYLFLKDDSLGESLQTSDCAFAHLVESKIVSDIVEDSDKAHKSFIDNLHELNFERNRYLFVGSIVHYNEIIDDILFSNMLKIDKYKIENGVSKPVFKKDFDSELEERFIRIKYKNDELKFHRDLNQDLNKVSSFVNYEMLNNNEKLLNSFLKLLSQHDYKKGLLMNTVHNHRKGNIFLYKIFELPR